MLLDSILAKIFYKLFLVFFSVYIAANGAPATPSQDNVIKASDDAVASFVIIADPQLGSLLPERYSLFQSAVKDIKASEGLDAIVCLGDMAENGLALEYQLYYDQLSDYDIHWLGCEGNHDIRLRAYKQSTKRFGTWLNTMNKSDEAPTDTFHYTTDVNGVKFIIMGSDRTEFEENYLSPEQLNWVDKELQAQGGEPTFVIVHQPLKNTNGLPDAWGSPIKDAGSIGKQSDELQAILDKYDNVYLVTGHEHSAFEENYYYEKVGNINSINVPSLTVNKGQTYVVEVFEDSVQFKARNLVTGQWLPQYDVIIPIAQ